MNQKRRSKVREQPTTEPSDALPTDTSFVEFVTGAPRFPETPATFDEQHPVAPGTLKKAAVELQSTPEQAAAEAALQRLGGSVERLGLTVDELARTLIDPDGEGFRPAMLPEAFQAAYGAHPDSVHPPGVVPAEHVEAEERATKPMEPPDTWGRYRMVSADGDEDEPTTPTLVDPAVVDTIVQKLDADPHLRRMIATYMAANHAITMESGRDLLVGERFVSPEAKFLDQHLGREESRARGSVTELHVSPLWVGRLQVMAKAADCSPQRYLDTLISRAWTGLDRSKRVGR